MSFFSNAQESPALVFSELHVEMLAFNLQFSRLDDVIHFPLKGPTLPHSFWGMEEKSAGFVQILWGVGYGWPPCGWQPRAGAFDLRRTNSTMLWVAALAAQFTISCACSTERARPCRNESIQVPINRLRVNARRFPRQSNWRLVHMILTPHSALGTSACSRPVIYFRSPAG